MVRIPQTIASYYLPNVLAKFQRVYPRVNFEFSNCSIHLAHELSAGIIDWVNRKVTKPWMKPPKDRCVIRTPYVKMPEDRWANIAGGTSFFILVTEMKEIQHRSN